MSVSTVTPTSPNAGNINGNPQSTAPQWFTDEMEKLHEKIAEQAQMLRDQAEALAYLIRRGEDLDHAVVYLSHIVVGLTETQLNQVKIAGKYIANLKRMELTYKIELEVGVAKIHLNTIRKKLGFKVLEEK